MQVTQCPPTSIDEIFAYLYQDLFYNPGKQATAHKVRADAMKEEWIADLEQIFKRKGLRFSYSLQPSQTKNGCTSAPIYTFTVER